MKNVQRYDRGELAKPVEMANGWLKCDGMIGRTGILEYQRADGTAWREYRPPEEAFHPDTLASFALVPLTNSHPPGGMLTAENTREYQRGTVEQPTRDGEHMRSSILITDAATIADAKAGKVELSCGYMADVDPTPGEINGQRYDAVQRNVRGNHVAMVGAGRAGPTVRLRVDSLNADAVQSDATAIGNAESIPHSLHKEQDNMKIKIRGVEYEVSDQVAQALESERTDARQTLDTSRSETKAAQADAEKFKAHADTATAKIQKLEAEVAAAPVKVRESLKARMQLEAEALKHLGEEKIDGKTDAEIKRAVAEKVTGLKLDGKSEAYVDAMFDVAIKREPAISDEPATAPVSDARTDAVGDAMDKARAEYMKALQSHFSK